MDINKIALVLANGDENLAEIKAYYLKGMLHNLTILTSTLIASYLLDVFQYALLIILTLILIRTKTGGCHSESMTLCKIITFAGVLGMALMASVIQISSTVLVIWSFSILLFGLYMIYRFAPLDSPKRPIISTEFRRQLKVKSYIFFIIWMTIIYIFSYYGYSKGAVSVLLSLSFHFFLMTKLGYQSIAKVDSIFIER